MTDSFFAASTAAPAPMLEVAVFVYDPIATAAEPLNSLELPPPLPSGWAMPELAMTLGRSFMLASTIRLPPTLTALFAPMVAVAALSSTSMATAAAAWKLGVESLAGPLLGELLLAVEPNSFWAWPSTYVVAAPCMFKSRSPVSSLPTPVLTATPVNNVGRKKNFVPLKPFLTSLAWTSVSLPDSRGRSGRRSSCRSCRPLPLPRPRCRRRRWW